MFCQRSLNNIINKILLEEIELQLLKKVKNLKKKYSLSKVENVFFLYGLSTMKTLHCKIYIYPYDEKYINLLKS